MTQRNFAPGGDRRLTFLPRSFADWLAPRKPERERHYIRKGPDWHVNLIINTLNKVLDSMMSVSTQFVDVAGIEWDQRYQIFPGQASHSTPSILDAVSAITVRFSEGHLFVSRVQDRSSLDHPTSEVIHRRSKVEPLRVRMIFRSVGTSTQTTVMDMMKSSRAMWTEAAPMMSLMISHRLGWVRDEITVRHRNSPKNDTWNDSLQDKVICWSTPYYYSPTSREVFTDTTWDTLYPDCWDGTIFPTAMGQL